MTVSCNVCQSVIEKPVYQSTDKHSITSLADVIDGKTQVYFCQRCTHLTTTEIPETKAYYANQYQLNVSSDEEDQLYEVVNNTPIYRTDKQATLFLQKVGMLNDINVLDYGCGKAATLKKICEKSTTITPHLFDITADHVAFWSTFVKHQNYSCFDLPSDWVNKFGVITSFYALEHISDLKSSLSSIHEMLVEHGIFYFMVPNAYQNIADFIVADHVNHFSSKSLHCVLTMYGFDNIEIDETSFSASYIVKATKRTTGASECYPDKKYVDHMTKKVNESAAFWRDVVARISRYEKDAEDQGKLAIYGAGFYGRFIASCISQQDRIHCFIDQNEHLQGTTMLNKPIVSPADCPVDIRNIFVGLNPAHAKSIIEGLTQHSLADKRLFFL
jgi:SAM-dependent methyltransferase